MKSLGVENKSMAMLGLLQEVSILLSLVDQNLTESSFLAVITTQRQDSMIHGSSMLRKWNGNVWKVTKTTSQTNLQKLEVLVQEPMQEQSSMRTRFISLVVMEEPTMLEFPLTTCLLLISILTNGRKLFQIQELLCQMVVVVTACLLFKTKSTFMVDGTKINSTTVSGSLILLKTNGLNQISTMVYQDGIIVQLSCQPYQHGNFLFLEEKN